MNFLPARMVAFDTGVRAAPRNYKNRPECDDVHSQTPCIRVCEFACVKFLAYMAHLKCARFQVVNVGRYHTKNCTGAGRMAPPASTIISARMQRVQGQISPVKILQIVANCKAACVPHMNLAAGFLFAAAWARLFVVRTVFPSQASRSRSPAKLQLQDEPQLQLTALATARLCTRRQI